MGIGGPRHLSDDAVPGPDPADLSGAREQWRRRQWALVAALAIAAGAMWLSLDWWSSQRAANDRLLEEGVLVSATVTDVRPSRGPDRLTVEFVHDGRRYERDIHTGFAGGYSRSNRGREIGVLFDPGAPDLVRTPSGRNMNPWTWLSYTMTGFAGYILLRELRRTRVARRVLESDEWAPGRLSIESPERRRPGRLELIDSEGRTTFFKSGWSGSVGADHFRTAAHYAAEGRWTVIIPAGTRKATLGRRWRRLRSYW